MDPGANLVLLLFFQLGANAEVLEFFDRFLYNVGLNEGLRTDLHGLGDRGQRHVAAVQLAVAPDANRCFSVAAPKPALYSPHVKKTVLVYGLLGGVLIAALQLIQYRFLVLEHSVEIYGGLVALVFSALGIWLGRKL